MPAEERLINQRTTGSLPIYGLFSASAEIFFKTLNSMLTLEQKKNIVKDLAQEIKSAQGVVFTEYQGLPTRDLQELRATLRKEKVKHQVVKLTLLKRALKQIGIDLKEFNYQVPLSVSFSAEDEVASARILQAFAKKHEQLKLVAGILDQKFIDMTAVKKLASLPGKLELRGQLVSVIAGPLRGLVSVLSGNMRGLLNVLSAVKEFRS